MAQASPPPLKLPMKVSYGLGTVAFGISGAVLYYEFLTDDARRKLVFKLLGARRWDAATP